MRNGPCASLGAADDARRPSIRFFAPLVCDQLIKSVRVAALWRFVVKGVHTWLALTKLTKT